MAEQKTELVTDIESKPASTIVVVGGGVAGMQAALDVADQDFQVYLVEESPSIGGKMASLDKTFPTLDCSACILTPKLSEVDRHPNITLLTYSEIEKVEGEQGDFDVVVLKKARYVDKDKCSACGECVSQCPIEVPSEFEQGIGFRKAIYRPFPQAMPNSYTIDIENCIKCNRCVDACGRDAIDHDMKDERLHINAGAIIIATGYDLFDVSRYPRLGYGKYQDVIHALEYERLINASGPTKGHLIRLSDGAVPKSIGFIQCVGARDINKGVPHCSRICCMYGIKNAVMAKEHHPDIDVTVYYLDIRAFGKGFEEFYEMAKTRFGVNFMRGRVGEVYEDSDSDSLLVRVEDTTTGQMLERKHDLIVLSPGVEPTSGLKKVAKTLNMDLDDTGYIGVPDTLTKPVDTKISGIFVCGCAEGPKDIPDSVASGSAAAMQATIALSKKVA
ncbi:MAG: CoB--CoM heterodisulfide reductase iron-sulfur subunit A family protein [Candidatus Thorarchaeota archaeon]